MIPVLSASAIREADACTVANEGISSWTLMERAAKACTERIIVGAPDVDTQFVVLAGMGNNGGDGLAIARLLKERGRKARVLSVQHRLEPSPNNAENLSRVVAMGLEVMELTEKDHGVALAANEVLIDALFGTGLSKVIDGWVADLIEAINATNRPVISIDLPSGMVADGGPGPGATINASHTLTINGPKRAFFLPEYSAQLGELEVVPIGLDPDFLAKVQTPYHLVEERDVATVLRPRPSAAHKGNFGHALIIAGSKGRMGACILATRAALRSGVGLLTAHLPGCGLELVQTSAPEAMCSPDPSQVRITELPDLRPHSAIGIGPGLGTQDDTSLVIRNLIKIVACPCVIDADALNVLAENPTWLSFLPKDAILTPHPKELDRLVGRTMTTGHERLDQARDLAIRSRCHIVLKGEWTAICDPNGQVFFNPTGNPGMAKGGSGDALTGILTGLLAQGYSPSEACILGVYAHGLAGDFAAAAKGMDGMIVTDLIEHLPAAWRHLREVQNNVSTSPLP